MFSGVNLHRNPKVTGAPTDSAVELLPIFAQLLRRTAVPSPVSSLQDWTNTRSLPRHLDRGHARHTCSVQCKIKGPNSSEPLPLALVHLYLSLHLYLSTQLSCARDHASFVCFTIIRP
ncbi:hypothetical protein J6590_031244 [Homalodisca vitripennis]|nr:hypothetical protein J6590_031244 [Homalodisca vitripennis]